MLKRNFSVFFCIIMEVIGSFFLLNHKIYIWELRVCIIYINVISIILVQDNIERGRLFYNFP